MTPNDPLEGELVAALRSPMTTTQTAGLDARMREASQGHRMARRPMLGLGRKVALVAAALIILPLGAAATGMLGGGTESPNGLIDAAGFQQEIDAAEAVVPIPTGVDWPDSINAGPGNYYSAGGGRVQVENLAFCLWSQAWLGADQRGDAAASRQALGVLKDYRTWTSYTGVFATQSYRDVVDTVVDGAITGQRVPVTRFVTINCAGI